MSEQDVQRPAPLWAVRPYFKQMVEHHACAVYLALRSRWNYDTGRCDPGNDRIALDLGIDVRTVKSAKRLMRTLGVLDWTPRNGASDLHRFPEPPSPGVGGLVTQPPASHEGGHPMQGVHTVQATPLIPCNNPPHMVQEPPSSHAPRSNSKKEEKKDRRDSAADAAGGPAGRSSSAPALHGFDQDQAEGGSTQPLSTASKPSPDAGGKNPKARPLTDDAITAIKSDLACGALGGYLLCGPAAIGVPQDQWASLSPSGTHWAPASKDYSRPDPDASTTALAGYAMYRINCARVVAGQPIELMNIGKLIGVVKNLRRQMTQAEFVGVVDAVGKRWNDVRAGLPPWMDTLPLMNETLLANAHVLNAAKSVVEGRPAQQAQSAGAMTPAMIDFNKQLEARVGRVQI